MSDFDAIIDELPRIRDIARGAREVLLANLVMVGEIPGPTFEEQRRARWLADRLNELGLEHCSTDEVDNSFGIIPGEDERADRNILIVAHLDTVFSNKVDHTLTVQQGSVVGPGVGDNSLGLASLATLPTVLEQLGIRFASNIILMGASRSLGRGNLEGLRFFLQNNPKPVQAGICVEGTQLGRLSLSSVGMVRGEIAIRVPEQYDWSKYGSAGAIIHMNEVINKLLAIPFPTRPMTQIVLGAIRGGKAYNTVPTECVLRFEVRSENREMVADVTQRIQDLVDEVGAQTGTEATLSVFAHRDPGGMEFSHPLARGVRQLMDAMDIEAQRSPSVSELSEFIAHRIPALTLGVTTGERLHTERETLDIAPMSDGLALLIATLKAIDRGACQ